MTLMAEQLEELQVEPQGQLNRDNKVRLHSNLHSKSTWTDHQLTRGTNPRPQRCDCQGRRLPPHFWPATSTDNPRRFVQGSHPSTLKKLLPNHQKVIRKTILMLIRSQVHQRNKRSKVQRLRESRQGRLQRSLRQSHQDRDCAKHHLSQPSQSSQSR